jgi:type IV secretory pathway VirB10-like protein
MSSGGVDGSEMDDMDRVNELDDAATEALISGLGRDSDPALTDLLGDVRVAYRSQLPEMSAALALLIAGAPSPVSPANRRIPKMRSLLTAKVAAVAASVLAGTGGLAVAGALNSPVRSVVSEAASHVGLAHGHAPKHTAKVKAAKVVKAKSAAAVETPTTTAGSDTPATTDPPASVTPEPTDPPEACDSPDTPETPDTDDATAAAPTGAPSADPCPPVTPVTPPAKQDDGDDDQQEQADQHQSDSQSNDQQSADQGDLNQSDSQSHDQHSSDQSTQPSGDTSSSDSSGSD